MCWLCDKMGPICRFHTDPNWAEGGYRRVPFVPPSPDDLLADQSSAFLSVSQRKDEQHQQQPRTPRPNAAQPLNRQENTGASRPNPAVFAGILPWPAMAS
jgi:hypothetical protein